MFADGRTRITLLAVVFITSMMLTFSDSFFQRRREYAPAVICRKKSGRTNVTGHQQFPRWCDDNRCQRRYAG